MPSGVQHSVCEASEEDAEGAAALTPDDGLLAAELRAVRADRRAAADADRHRARRHVGRQVEAVCARRAAGGGAGDGGELAHRLRVGGVARARPAPGCVAGVPAVQVHSRDAGRGEVPHRRGGGADRVVDEDAAGVALELDEQPRGLGLQPPDRRAHRPLAARAGAGFRRGRQAVVRLGRVVERPPAQAERRRIVPAQLADALLVALRRLGQRLVHRQPGVRRGSREQHGASGGQEHVLSLRSGLV